MTSRVAMSILKKNGWVLVRTKGSHNQFKKPGNSYLATVPKHPGKEISIGVLSDLRKGTGIDELV